MNIWEEDLIPFPSGIVRLVGCGREKRKRGRAYRLLRRYALAGLVQGGYGFVSFLRVLAWLFQRCPKLASFCSFLFYVRNRDAQIDSQAANVVPCTATPVDISAADKIGLRSNSTVYFFCSFFISWLVFRMEGGTNLERMSLTSSYPPYVGIH